MAFNDKPFAYHYEMELEITSLTNQGQGVGRVDNWVVMVPFTIPGERVRARIFRNHKNYSEADLVEVLQASPHRVSPQCSLFGECGGCQYQHLEYSEQLQWKQRQVKELFAHMADLAVEVEEAVPSPRLFGYRSKITPHYRKPRDGTINEIGFLRPGRRNAIIDVPQCPLATEAININLPSVRESLRSRAGQLKKGGTLLLREGFDGVETNPKKIIREKVGELMFHFPAGEFFQNNPFILPQLVQYVMEQAKSTGAEYLLDAYCGSGLFALSGAKKFQEVEGVEISEAAIRWARENAKRNEIKNVRLTVGDAAEIFAQTTFPPKQTTVVIDPPRKGSTPEFLQQLLEYRPGRVVYVSCNPATQIRDLKQLDEGGYQLTRLQPFDLFPQTKHLECVATLDLRTA
ncbi:MAG: class I SAM-dependent RNA methyltransferase [Opitutales bacterium]|nr:class I SAM-dependent RNA methyltransferase [Opitutales bacterium]